MRVCDLCGVVDDGPRHIIGHAPGSVSVDLDLVERVWALDIPDDVRSAALEALNDSTLQIRHLTCCAAAGCDICTPTEEN